MFCRGALYADQLYDADVAQSMLKQLKLPRISSDMVLEGGSIHTDGQGCGTLLLHLYRFMTSP